MRALLAIAFFVLATATAATGARAGEPSRPPVRAPFPVAGIDVPVGRDVAGPPKPASEIPTTKGGIWRDEEGPHTIHVEQAGAVLENFDLRGYTVRVQAPGVTIRQNLFSTIAPPWPTNWGYIIRIDANTPGTVITRNSFDGEKRDVGHQPVIFAELETGPVTITYNEFVHYPSDGMKVFEGEVAYNMFREGGYGTGAHADVMEIIHTSGPLHIHNNLFDHTRQPDARVGANAVFKIWQELGGQIRHEILIEHNILRGGGYTVYQQGPFAESGRLIVRDNLIGDWQYGPFCPCVLPQFVASHNISLKTGRPLPDIRPPPPRATSH